MDIQIIRLCELYIFLFHFLIIITRASLSNNSHGRFQETEVVSINVFQNERLQNDMTVSIHIATTSNVFKLKLHQAPTILHQDVQAFSSATGQNKESVLSKEYLDPDIQRIDSNFFHNIETGSVLSITKTSDGSHNLEGFIDPDNIIVPPNSELRHKRAIKPDRHAVFTADKGDRLKYKNRNWQNIQSDQVMMNNLLRKGFDRLYGKDTIIQHLIDNHRDIDRSEEDKDAELDDEDDDYKEVPPFFETEETWKAHQRQAEAKTNSITEKNDDDDDDDDNYKRIKLPKSFKDDIFKSLSKISNLPLISNSESLEEDWIPLRIKRDLGNIKESNFNSNPEKKYIMLHKRDDMISHFGQTEPSLKQTTTHEILSQIPRPFHNILSFENIISNQVESTKSKHHDEKEAELLMHGHVSLDESDFLALEKTRQRRQVPVELQLGKEVMLNYGSTGQGVKSQKGPFTIEVHAVVDASLYQDFNYNWKTLQIFLLHFWQSVNNRFKALVNPHVELKIKAISKIMFPGFQPFIENNRVKSNSDWVDVDKVLESFKSYVQEQFELNPLVPEHDVAFLMTGENLCKRKADGSWSKKSRGIAYVRGACISAKRFRSETYDVGISEVGRSFSGILTTTHELAHLVGAFHDGNKNSVSCPSSAGYIMGGAWNDPVKFNQFSQCSKTNMQNFMENAWYANCLTDSVEHKNSVTYTFPKELPGQVISLEEQCYHFIGGVPCKNIPLSSQCGQLCCEKWSQVFKSREPAADGTRCGAGKICERGQCIKEAIR